jgi:hypothetical protein
MQVVIRASSEPKSATAPQTFFIDRYSKQLENNVSETLSMNHWITGPVIEVSTFQIVSLHSPEDGNISSFQKSCVF